MGHPSVLVPKTRFRLEADVHPPEPPPQLGSSRWPQAEVAEAIHGAHLSLRQALGLT